MKKRKLIFTIVGGVLTLLVLAVAVAWIWIDTIAKRAVEDGGQYALGVPTKVDSVNLSLLGGSLKMDTLNVSNPDGYKSPHLMRTGQFHLAVVPGSVLSDTVVIPTFELDSLDINIETKDLANNINVVLDHVKKLSGDSPGQQDPKASGKKVRVDKVVIRNVVAHVALGLPGTKPLDIKVPTIELNNVSSDKGISIDQLIGRLLPAIVASVLESGKGIIPQDLLAGLTGDLAGTVSALGSQASAQVQQALQNVGKVVPIDAAKAAGQTSHQVQDALDHAQKASLSPLQNLTGVIATTQPTVQPQQKNGPGRAVDSLFKKH